MGIVALAGRRVDAAGASEARFPSANVDAVRARLREQLKALDVTRLVASAASGADLLGLEEAQSLGAHTIVILPFDRERFRATSVEDRPNPDCWRATFERMIAISKVETLAQGFTSDWEAYAAVTRRIVDAAVELNPLERAAALAVWDGRSRGKDDNTDYFVRYAGERGLAVIEVPTLT